MKQRLLTGVVCLGVLSASLALAACDVKVGEKGLSLDVAQGRAGDEWNRTYTVSQGGRLEIVSGGGPINVSKSDGPNVQIHIVREARAASDEAAQQALQDETIVEEVTPERVRVETTRRPGQNTGPLGRRRISTEYRVSIPEGLTVALKGENADISLANVHGHFILENTNGGFRGRGLSGSVEATTVNGIIQLDFAQVTGDVKGTTVNGPVRIGLPQDLNASLDARTVNGGVTIGEQLPFTPTARERLHVAGRVGGGGPVNIVLHTTNGPVRVGVAGVQGERGRDLREIESR